VASIIGFGGALLTGIGDQTFRQQGRLNVAAGNSQEVYYPIAYRTPPNLQLDGDANWQFVKLLEQKADHFKISCTAQFGSTEVRWRAEGVRR
jgi:hypothetical protein